MTESNVQNLPLLRSVSIWLMTVLTTEAVLTLVFQRPWERRSEGREGERQKPRYWECVRD